MVRRLCGDLESDHKQKDDPDYEGGPLSLHSLSLGRMDLTIRQCILPINPGLICHDRRRPSKVRLVVGAIAIAIALGAGFWAGSTIASSDPTVPARAETISIAVRTMTVERSVVFEGEVLRMVEHQLTADQSGRITGLMSDGIASEGSVVFTINSVPVVLAEGSIPSYRDLSIGDVGEDVRQLQEFLDRQGHTIGEADGRFGSATRVAVRDWQKTNSAEATGTVQLGSIQWVPTTPVVVSSGETRVGEWVDSSSVIVEILARKPSFRLRLGEQRNLVPEEPLLLVDFGTRQVPAALGQGIVDEFGTSYLLEPLQGDSICEEPCLEVGFRESGTIPIEVVFVPETTGPAVPVAAIRYSEDGHAFVRNLSGTELEIRVLAVDSGMAVVDGIDEGVEILLPADEAFPGVG